MANQVKFVDQSRKTSVTGYGDNSLTTTLTVSWIPDYDFSEGEQGFISPKEFGCGREFIRW